MNNFITKKFCVLSAVYAGVLLISNILANKIIMPFGYVLPCAVILFPLVYVLSDLMTEVYGLRLSKIAITTNAILNLFMSVIFIIAVNIPSAPFFDATAFNAVLGSTPRMVIASLISYYLGDMINSYSLSFFKSKLEDAKIKFLGTFFFRSIISSMLGQIFDTLGFIFMAFYGTVPNSVLLTMMLCQYTVKIGYQVIIYPFMHYIVAWWKRSEGFDVVDAW